MTYLVRCSALCGYTLYCCPASKPWHSGAATPSAARPSLPLTVVRRRADLSSYALLTRRAAVRGERFKWVMPLSAAMAAVPSLLLWPWKWSHPAGCSSQKVVKGLIKLITGAPQRCFACRLSFMLRPQSVGRPRTPSSRKRPADSDPDLAPCWLGGFKAQVGYMVPHRIMDPRRALAGAKFTLDIDVASCQRWLFKRAVAHRYLA